MYYLNIMQQERCTFSAAQHLTSWPNDHYYSLLSYNLKFGFVSQRAHILHWLVLKCTFLISYSVFCFSSLKHNEIASGQKPCSHHPHSSSITACHNPRRKWSFAHSGNRCGLLSWVVLSVILHTRPYRNRLHYPRACSSLFVLKCKVEHLIRTLYWCKEFVQENHPL